MQFSTTKNIVTTNTSTGILSADEVAALVTAYAKEKCGAGSAATAKATRADDGSFSIEIVDILTGDAPTAPAKAAASAADAATTPASSPAAPSIGLQFPKQ